MAKVGLRYPVYSPATETDDSISYGAGLVLGRAIMANIDIEPSDEKLYADDMVAESDTGFSSGTVQIGLDDLYDDVKVALLGYIEGNIIDVITGARELAAGEPEQRSGGLGFYGKVVRRGKNYWRAIWLKKVQFAEPSDSTETKGENVSFQTPELEGIIMMAPDQRWKEEGTFSTEAGARAWLDGKAGIADTVAPIKSTVASGAYTTAQSVELSTETASADIYYTDNGTIPSQTNGTKYTVPIELTSPTNINIRAIGFKAAHYDSPMLELLIQVQA